MTTLAQIRRIAAISAQQADRIAATSIIRVRHKVTGVEGTLIGISDDGWPIVDLPGAGYAASWSFNVVEEVSA